MKINFINVSLQQLKTSLGIWYKDLKECLLHPAWEDRLITSEVLEAEAGGSQIQVLYGLLRSSQPVQLSENLSQNKK